MESAQKHLRHLTMRFNLNDGHFFCGSADLALRMYEAFLKDQTRASVIAAIEAFKEDKIADIDFEQTLTSRIPRNVVVPFQENVVTVFQYEEKYRVEYVPLVVEDLIEQWREIYLEDYNTFQNIGREIREHQRIFSHFRMSLIESFRQNIINVGEMAPGAEEEIAESLKSVNIFQMRDYLTYRQEVDDRIGEGSALKPKEEGFIYEYYSPSAGRQVTLRIY